MERSRRARRVADLVWAAALGLVAFLLLSSGIIATASLVPAFCTACHGQAGSALKESAHAGIHCDACHGGATFFDAADRRLATVSMVVAWVLPGGQPAVASIPNDMCLECHAEDMRVPVERNGIRMSHTEVVDAKWSCEACHPETAHGTPQDRKYSYTMDSCLECHSVNPRNIASCEQCHIEGERANDVRVSSQWTLVHGPEWRQTHGLGNLKTCSACHEAEKCVGCHGMQVPHDAAFPAVHGQLVVRATDGRAKCLTCHRNEACDGCHGIDMPHPDDFLKVHVATIERVGESSCTRCHLQASCDACHAAHAHPGLKEEYMRRLRANPVTY